MVKRQAHTIAAGIALGTGAWALSVAIILKTYLRQTQEVVCLQRM